MNEFDALLNMLAETMSANRSKWNLLLKYHKADEVDKLDENELKKRLKDNLFNGIRPIREYSHREVANALSGKGLVTIADLKTETTQEIHDRIMKALQEQFTTCIGSVLNFD